MKYKKDLEKLLYCIDGYISDYNDRNYGDATNGCVMLETNGKTSLKVTQTMMILVSMFVN